MRSILLILVSGVVWAQNPLAEAVARNNEGTRLLDEGRYAESEALFRAALGGRYDDDLVRAKVAHNLGVLYRQQDRYRDAEKMFRVALQWQQKDLPSGSAEIAYSLNNLAQIYQIEGRNWEARNLLETSVESLQQFHPDDPSLPLIVGNLAGVHCLFGKFDEAEALLRAALVSYEKRHEAPGREYGITLNNLGRVLQAKNNLEEADQLYAQAARIFESLGAPSRPDLAATLSNAGVLYQSKNRLEEARQNELRALELLRPNGDEVLRANILKMLGNIVAEAGDAAGSLPYFEQSLSIQEQILGAEHPVTANLLLDYASAAMRAGNKSLSRKLHKRAVELRARINRQSLEDLTVSARSLSAAR
jgi:tetratricopeptide (TPR) repeat protein